MRENTSSTLPAPTSSLHQLRVRVCEKWHGQLAKRTIESTQQESFKPMAKPDRPDEPQQPGVPKPPGPQPGNPQPGDVPEPPRPTDPPPVKPAPDSPGPVKPQAVETDANPNPPESLPVGYP